MQAHFDTVGPAGRRMMRCTASTQVCLDWWPGRAGLEQWRVLNLAGPFLAAAFARSAGPDSRLATWLAVDPDRTAFDDRLLRGGDPVAAYASFARAATRSPAPTSTCRRCSRRCGRAVATSRSASSTSSPRSGSAEVVGVLAALMYDDERARPGSSPSSSPRRRGWPSCGGAAADGPTRSRRNERGMRTLFVTDPAGRAARRHRRVGRPDGRLPGRGRRGLGLRAGRPRRLRRAAAGPGSADLAAPAAARRRPPVASSSRAGTTRSSHATLDVAATCELVWLRIDPPVDARYLHTTYLLDLAAAAGVRVVNHPAGVRALHEKLVALLLPELCPATLVTSRRRRGRGLRGGVRHARWSSRSTGSPAPTCGCCEPGRGCRRAGRVRDRAAGGT